MPVIFQKWIKREDARRNPEVLYVFGDNVRRVGRGGQAAELRGEVNAVGVATKYSPSSCFGNTPAQITAQAKIIDIDMKPLFEHLLKGGIVVWPSDGIGTGLAGLPTYAPESFEYIKGKLAALIRVGKLFDKGKVVSAVQEASTHRNVEKIPEPDDVCHDSHNVRSSDASSFDVICINCGATDSAGDGWGDLRFPCKKPVLL
jgi:hypothetical protein